MDTAMPEKSTNEKIFDKLDLITKQYAGIDKAVAVQYTEISGRLDVIDSNLDKKVDEPDMMKYVDDKLDRHGESSKVVDISGQKPSKPPGRDTIKINISGVRPVLKYILYVLAASGLLGGGHFIPKALSSPEAPAPVIQAKE